MARSIGGWIQRISLAVVIVLIIGAFVLVFGQPDSGPGVQVVAVVRGERVPLDLYNVTRQTVAERRREALPDDASRELEVAMIDQPAYQLLLSQFVLAQEARALGLRVSDEEIREGICSAPGLPRCDAEIVRDLVIRSGFPSVRSYTDQVRRDLLVTKLHRLLLSPIRISDSAVEERLRRERLSVRLRYAVARAGSFREEVPVDEAEAAAFAEANPDRVQAAYQRRIDEFRRPESVRARHILFQGEDAMDRARAARERLDAGEDFVVLAAELSDDPATRDNGGELGVLPRGRMVPAFDQAVFDAEERSVIGPVETPRGVHLIRVEEHHPAVERTLDEVKTLLAWDLLRDQRAAEKAREAAERMSALLAEGREFDAAAEKTGLELDETIHFRPVDPQVPGIGRIPGLAETASRLTPEAPVSPLVFGSEDAFYLISLAARSEPDPETLRAEIEPMRERMRDEAHLRLIQALYETRVQELREAGELIESPPYSS